MQETSGQGDSIEAHMLPTNLLGSRQEAVLARILLIEDEASIRRPLQLILERAGHQVFAAANGMEAVRLWRESSGDLVITDINMPEKDGLETIVELRQLSPRTPILAMSGSYRNGRVDVLGDATQLGAFRTIGKPFALREMLEAVEQLLLEAQ
jgi:DNA-binding response OmpR family regulator